METQKSAEGENASKASGIRNGLITLVKGGGAGCLLAMVVGAFLPFFSIGEFSFVTVLRMLLFAAEDEFVQGVARLLGYDNLALKAWLIVIGIIVFYILEWRAYRKVLDYPYHRGYGWNVWLMLSSVAGTVFFCYVGSLFDFWGQEIEIAGIGLLVLQWSHIVLIGLAIIALIVKCDYNNAKRREKLKITCSNCGRELIGTEKFCTRCGTKFEEDEIHSCAPSSGDNELKVESEDCSCAVLERDKDSDIQIEICESRKLALAKQIYDEAKEQMREATEGNLDLKKHENCMAQKEECEKKRKDKKRKKVIAVAYIAAIAVAVAAGSLMVSIWQRERRAKEEKERQKEQYNIVYKQMEQYAAQGQFEEAIEALCEVESVGSEEIVYEVVYELANEYENDGRYEEAKKAYEWLEDYRDSESRRVYIVKEEFLQWAEVHEESDGTYALLKVDPDKVPAVVEIPDIVWRIEEGAFKNCNRIEEVIMPDSVTMVGRSAFSGCKQLKKIKISENLHIINSYCFELCLGLTSIYIPDSVERIEQNAFTECSNLESMDVSEETYVDSDVFGIAWKRHIIKCRE